MAGKRNITPMKMALVHAIGAGVAWPFLLGVLFGLIVIVFVREPALTSLPMVLISYTFGMASIAFGVWHTHGFIARRYLVERPMFVVNRATIILAIIFTLSSALSWSIETQTASSFVYEFVANLVLLGVFYAASRAVFARTAQPPQDMRS